MKTFAEVRMLHIEISSRCNARCPGCPRNFYGFPFNGGYVEHDMTLNEFKNVLPNTFLKQIDEIWFNGNYGDFIMNPQGVDIVAYVRSCKPNIDIKISTNGSARNKTYWQQLGKLRTSVYFCLDGLEDTHSIYRQDTSFATIIENAKTFMSAGGKAFWQYTVFEHNAHQIESARALSQELGFVDFVSRPNTREDSPVYNRQGQKIFHLGKTNPRNLPDTVSEEYVNDQFANRFINGPGQHILCESIELNSLYIGATGAVTPCCYLDLPQPHNTAGKVNTRDKVTDKILQSVEVASSTQEYFPLVQQSWKTGPSGVCKRFCGK